LVGPDNVKLRVHSLVLKSASRTFFAMFEPTWKEGNMLGRNESTEVRLPEDNVTALRIICAVLHHRNELVPPTLTAGNILEIAIIADKYECIDALKFASQDWLQPRGNEAGDLMLLTAAAYLFQNAPAFKKITKAMILNHSGPYLALCSKKVESAITWRVFRKCAINLSTGNMRLIGQYTALLEEQRSVAKLKLAEILIAGINDADGVCVHACGWSSKYAYAYLNSLERHGLWPTGLVCISKAIQSAENMPDPVPTEQSIACVFARKHTPPEYRRNRRWKLDDLNNRIGLCLRCVRLECIDSSDCGGRH
jgi:hypothetical protein